MRKLTLIIAALLIFSFTALADIPQPNGKTKSPKRPVTVDTTMDITLDADAKDARLIIPVSQLQELRAQLDALDNGGDNMAGTSSFTKIQTIVAGTLMSLAFVFGGLWVSRNRKVLLNSRAVGIAAVASMLAAGATLLYANAGPPASARSITGKLFNKDVQAYRWGYGKIKLETGTGDTVRLIVPNPKDTKAADEE